MRHRIWLCPQEIFFFCGEGRKVSPENHTYKYPRHQIDQQIELALGLKSIVKFNDEWAIHGFKYEPL